MGSIPWQNPCWTGSHGGPSGRHSPWQMKKVEVREGNRNCLVPP